MSKMILVVCRQEKIIATTITVITADVNEKYIQSDQELLNEFSNGVEQWVRNTEDGREFYEQSCGEPNVGDVLSDGCITDILGYCPNIREFDIELVGDCSEVWNFDTCLCPEIDFDE